MDWLNFRNPSGETDATNEQDMNTFISITREATVTDMKDAMEWIKKIEGIAVAVEDVWADSLAQRKTEMQRRASEHLSTLHSMILEKVDQATLPLLRFYDKYVDDRTEMNIEEIATNASVGMWATFSDMRPPRKSVQLERMGIKLDIPKPLLQQQEKFTYRFIRMPIVTYNLNAYDEEKMMNAEIGSRRNRLPTKYVVGDLIYFDILLAPPSPFFIRAKKWTLRDHSSHSMTIRKSEYPSSAQCRMYVKVPDGVVLSEDLRVAVWDELEQDWVEDGISDFQCNESTRTVQFYITTVGLLALVKKRTVDIPLKKWTIYPVLSKKINTFMQYSSDAAIGYLSEKQLEENFRGLTIVKSTPSQYHGGMEAILPLSYERHARLVVQSQQFEVTIDIIGSQCCLIKPDSNQFSDLLYKALSPGCLLKRLQRKGVSLLPAHIDLNQSETYKAKLPILEDYVLKQVARGVSAVDFISSDWNQTLSSSQIGLLARESTVYTCPTEENEYDCVLVQRDEVSTSYKNTPELGFAPGPDGIQFSLVIGNDYGRRPLFSPVLRPDENVHMDLSRTLANRLTPEALNRMRRVNERFQRTVYTLLSLIKPFSQS
eukprot:scaffold2392_cov166-Ochromonas_danica.AAC.7